MRMRVIVLSGRSSVREERLGFGGGSESVDSESGSVWLSDSLTLCYHMVFRDGKMGTYLDRKSWT